jgi:hypothetical protein
MSADDMKTPSLDEVLAARKAADKLEILRFERAEERKWARGVATNRVDTPKNKADHARRFALWNAGVSVEIRRLSRIVREYRAQHGDIPSRNDLASLRAQVLDAYLARCERETAEKRALRMARRCDDTTSGSVLSARNNSPAPVPATVIPAHGPLPEGHVLSDRPTTVFVHAGTLSKEDWQAVNDWRNRRGVLLRVIDRGAVYPDGIVSVPADRSPERFVHIGLAPQCAAPRILSSLQPLPKRFVLRPVL